VLGDKDGQHWSLVAQTGMGGMAWPGARSTCAHLPSWPTLLTSCLLDGSRDKIFTPEKSQVNLSSGRFLKRKNT
jgi:hypothetical protein